MSDKTARRNFLYVRVPSVPAPHDEESDASVEEHIVYDGRRIPVKYLLADLKIIERPALPDARVHAALVDETLRQTDVKISAMQKTQQKIDTLRETSQALLRKLRTA